MDTLLRDIRHGFRSLMKRPAFTVIAIVTLSLGIGANTAIFSTINALLLKPLPFGDLDRIVALWDKVPSRGVERNEVTVADYLDWKAQNTSFEQLGIYRWWSTNLTGSDSPERVQGFQVTTNFLDIVGVKPILGRNFSAEENQPGKDAVALLTYSLWQRRFGGDPNIVNKIIATNGIQRTVIGVLPPEFNYPKGAEIYSPLALTPKLSLSRDNHSYLGIGRLKPGVSIQTAQAELNTIAAQLAKQYPETNTDRGVGLYPILADTVRLYSTALWVLMAAVGFVLLIGCANVANLMLARAAGRQREIALRAALGASRFRIVRQLLTESVMLGIAGGALGILIGYWGVDLIRTASPGEAARFAPGWSHLGINLPVLGFALLLSILSGVVFGLVPAWQLSKTDLNNALKEGGQQSTSSSQRLRGLLVVAEVALSLMLLVSAGLLIRSFMQLVKANPGFESENLMTMNLVVPTAKYKEESQRSAFYVDLLRRVEDLPGVSSAAIVNHLPLGGSNSSSSFLVEGIPEPPPGQEFEARYRVCSPGYFQTMGIPLMQGRAFTDQDRPGTPLVTIVNETLARKYWPNQDPIGKRIRNTGPPEENPWMQVVGVAADVKHELNLPVLPEYYTAHAQDVWSSMVLVAKTKVEPEAMAAPIRQQVWAIDKDQPVFDAHSMKEVRGISLALHTFSSVMLSIFAAVALLLAAVGIYGVMAFNVTQRTHEIGIRMALGARAADVMKLMVGNGMLMAVIGVLIGLAGAYGLTRLMASLLFGVSPTDLWTFGIVTFGLLMVALLACYIPARRATRVDPLVALRYE
ncbi:MAG TPA: ABC transporter permease [Pyrinomonadaceae bacterium]|jgi:putative ABC transport system permease protein|nr:ABC transporter permease [Pyrinomonadaceae bacterium]